MLTNLKSILSNNLEPCYFQTSTEPICITLQRIQMLAEVCWRSVHKHTRMMFRRSIKITDNKNTGDKIDVGCSGLVQALAEEQEENRTLYIPHQTEGARPPAAGDSSCSRHLHSSPATAQRITLNEGMINVDPCVANGQKRQHVCCDRENAPITAHSCTRKCDNFPPASV